MAIRFSLVSVTAADKEANFFVGGIPKGFEDLEGWTAYVKASKTMKNWQNALKPYRKP